ncbi:eIF2B alpha/beta/delta subunit family protein [Methanomassiliicoccus luminyensis]|nr:hypothetical protein [Methanomassiliicoccus luminyensis]
MDRRLHAIADSLAGDVRSGAAEMMGTVLDGILAIPDDDAAAIPTREWEDFAVAMHRGKPSIAPVFNIANSIMLLAEEGASGLARLREVLTEMKKMEKRSGPLIAEEAARSVKGDWIMTTSYSSTVAKALLALSERRSVKVTITESAPGAEGRQFARLLSEHMDCEIIYDSTIFARMADVDAAITGADSMTGGGLINKVGTRALAEAARSAGVPAYALCGWSKVCPVILSDLMVRDEVIGERLSEHIQVFESTPLDLFAEAITDRGTMTPPHLRTAIKSGRVARGWSARGLIRAPPPESISRTSALWPLQGRRPRTGSTLCNRRSARPPPFRL